MKGLGFLEVLVMQSLKAMVLIVKMSIIINYFENLDHV